MKINKIKIVKHDLFGDCEYYPHGIPCKHSGCSSHKTHTCEYCGRIQCNGESFVPIKNNIIDGKEING